MNSVQLWSYSNSVYFTQVPFDQCLLVGMFTRSSYEKRTAEAPENNIFFNVHGIFLLELPAFTI